MDPIVLTVLERYITGRVLPAEAPVPNVNQTPSMCGPAALKSVLEYYGEKVEESTLAEESEATKDLGATAKNLLQAAKGHGFEGFIKDDATLDEVKKLVDAGTPVIIDWWKQDDGHYSVVSDITDEEIQFMDPEVGEKVWMARKEFEPLWFDFPAKDTEHRHPTNKRIIVIRPSASTRVARRFVAGLADQLQRMMGDLLGGTLEAKKGKDVAEWLEANFHFLGTKTPKGGKVLKDQVNKLHWFLKFGLSQQQDPEKLRPTIEAAWSDIQKELGTLVKLFSEEGGKVVPKEMKVGDHTYLNVSGFSEDQLTTYIKSLEQVFAELKGWRRKALAGGLKVALAGPSDFRGTSGGKYKSSEDTLYVRATPAVLKRTRGSYGAFDYIIVHELGHRYDYKRKPGIDFDRPEWWTSRYSRTEGESFAELFALTNFGISGQGDQAVLDKFEDYMTTGKVPETEPVELPDHLKRLLGK